MYHTIFLWYTFYGQYEKYSIPPADVYLVTNTDKKDKTNYPYSSSNLQVVQSVTHI